MGTISPVPTPRFDFARVPSAPFRPPDSALARWTRAPLTGNRHGSSALRARGSAESHTSCAVPIRRLVPPSAAPSRCEPGRWHGHASG